MAAETADTAFEERAAKTGYANRAHGRHAYLLMVHKNAPQVEMLIRALDHPDNDIYIHADTRFEDAAPERFARCAAQSHVYFSSDRAITWGSYDLFETPLFLLERALEHGPYAYYHLLSGQDFPLRSQDEIHAFFDGKDCEFVHFCKPEEWPSTVDDRVRIKRFPKLISGSKPTRIIEGLFAKFQKAIGINHLDDAVSYGFGANWFSITEDLAADMVAHRAWFREHFSHGALTDEIALQSFILTFGYEDRLFRPIGDGSYLGCMRCIEWSAGGDHPRVWRTSDLARLLNSPYMFARKIDMDVDRELIEKLLKHATPMGSRPKRRPMASRSEDLAHYRLPEPLLSSKKGA